MKYFREEENPTARLPQNFVQGFLEVGTIEYSHSRNEKTDDPQGTQLTFVHGYKARFCTRDAKP